MSLPVFEEQKIGFLLTYLAVATPIITITLALVGVSLILAGELPTRVLMTDVMLFTITPLAFAVLWHMALSRQPYRIFADRIEPAHRPARLAFGRLRHSISFSEISKCEVFDVTDSWGKPAFRRFESTLKSGGVVVIDVPDSLGRRAEDFLVDSLRRTGVTVGTHAMSLRDWEAERYRRKAEKGRNRTG
jgi:hypothetical protein